MTFCAVFGSFPWTWRKGKEMMERRQVIQRDKWSAVHPYSTGDVVLSQVPTECDDKRLPKLLSTAFDELDVDVVVTGAYPSFKRLHSILRCSAQRDLVAWIWGAETSMSGANRFVHNFLHISSTQWSNVQQNGRAAVLPYISILWAAVIFLLWLSLRSYLSFFLISLQRTMHCIFLFYPFSYVFLSLAALSLHWGPLNPAVKSTCGSFRVEEASHEAAKFSSISSSITQAIVASTCLSNPVSSVSVGLLRQLGMFSTLFPQRELYVF